MIFIRVKRWICKGSLDVFAMHTWSTIHFHCWHATLYSIFDILHVRYYFYKKTY
uniref:Uncharacterized protein n=1 Tax=Helianthus annuus TaxID=4232 RepID=A0A251VCF2_HELAN